MDREQTEKLYRTHYMRVFSFAMTLAGEKTLAEEITQETFFRAFSKSGEFRKESDEVTWLCAIAKNYFYDERRKQKRTEPMPEEIADSGKSIEQMASDRDPPFGSMWRCTPWRSPSGRCLSSGCSGS